MATRICLCDPASGAVLMAIDGRHGDGHAVTWAAAAADKLRATRGIDPVVVEYTPRAGGDDTLSDIQHIHEMRLDVHQRPDGKVDVLGLARTRPRADGVGFDVRHCAASLRVLDGPGGFERHPRGVHGRGRSGAELALEWRRVSDVPFKRLERKRGRA